MRSALYTKLLTPRDFRFILQAQIIKCTYVRVLNEKKTHKSNLYICGKAAHKCAASTTKIIIIFGAENNATIQTA